MGRRPRSHRLEDPPSKDPSTPRTICRPTVLPMVRAALFTIACTTVSPRRDPPDPSTPPRAVPAASRLPSQPEPEAAGSDAPPPPGATLDPTALPFNLS